MPSDVFDPTRSEERHGTAVERHESGLDAIGPITVLRGSRWYGGGAPEPTVYLSHNLADELVRYRVMGHHSVQPEPLSTTVAYLEVLDASRLMASWTWQQLRTRAQEVLESLREVQAHSRRIRHGAIEPTTSYFTEFENWIIGTYPHMLTRAGWSEPSESETLGPPEVGSVSTGVAYAMSVYSSATGPEVLVALEDEE